jgi:hypothetical protein
MEIVKLSIVSIVLFVYKFFNAGFSVAKYVYLEIQTVKFFQVITNCSLLYLNTFL